MMAWQKNFVVSIINQKNQVVREEAGDYSRVARVDFDSEYKIRIQNKTKRRAYARVEIDGMEVSPGRRFVLGPKDSVDLERFILDGDLTTGKRFKFMSLEKGAATGEIQDPTSKDNGKIKVTFEPELELPTVKFNTTLSTNKGGWSGGARGQSVLRGRGFSGSGDPGGPVEAQNFHNDVFYSSAGPTPQANVTHTGGSSTMEFLPSSVAEPVAATQDLGATAEGSVSNQQFKDSHDYFLTGPAVVIELMLKGMKPAPKTDWVIRKRQGQQGHDVIFKGVCLEGIEDVRVTMDGMVLTVGPVRIE
jgi:hypothetical protein